MFHFKKFSIDDSKSAMKVGTDSVLLGAWVPCENETRILDIGSGSGILALMMAQRNPETPVDAVEIVKDAARQSLENIKLSPWPEQVTVYNTSIQGYCRTTSFAYSLVVCNPPFFTDSLKAPDQARTMARHNESLPVAELLQVTSGILSEHGKAAFILPANDFEKWKSEASKSHLYPTYLTFVRSSQSHTPHRVLVIFAHLGIRDIKIDEIIIYQSRSVYTSKYKELTKDFYLNF
jgi:tRNA1Val (adenine37-N6)-methyltransferase